jgi:hypothetical protein
MHARRLLVTSAVALAALLGGMRSAPASVACAGKKSVMPGIGSSAPTVYCNPTCTPAECNCRPAVCPDATSVNND